MSQTSSSDDFSQDLKNLVEQDKAQAGRKEVWADIGATTEIVDDDKENEISNPRIDGIGSQDPVGPNPTESDLAPARSTSYDLSTQGLHLEINDTESQDLDAPNDEGGATRLTLKRPPLDDISEATHEKTRKIEKDVSDPKTSQSLIDNSVVILDDSIVETPKTIVEIDLSCEKLEEPDFMAKLVEAYDTSKVEDSPRQKSPSLLKPSKVVASESSDNKSGEESDPQLKVSIRSPSDCPADDEGSRQLSSSANSGRPQSSLVIDSPDITVSPIHVLEGDKHHRVLKAVHQQRRTSTPGHRRSPSKKLIKRQDDIPALGLVQDESSESSEIDRNAMSSSQDTMPINSGSFKVPGKSPNTSSADYSLVAVVVKSSDVPMLTNLLNEMGAENKLIAKKFAAEKVRELLSDLKRSFSGTAANKRVSDISSLSSQSRSSCSTTGYLADIGSSGSSTLTSGSSSVASKRDRYSICPEVAIEKHRVFSPLPTKTVSLKVEIRPSEPQSQNGVSSQQRDALSTIDEIVEAEKPKNKIDVQTKICVEKNVEKSIETVIVEPTKTPKLKKLLPRHIRDSRSRSKSPMTPAAAMSSKANGQCVDLNVTSTSDVSAGTKVFAKWVERTEVRYWAGCVQSVLDDDKYVVKFDDDGLERTLRRDDLIRVDALTPGLQVNVNSEEDDGIYRVAILISHPDLTLSNNDVGYVVEFEPLEGFADIETKMVPHRLIHLSEDQAKNFKREIGGVYNKVVMGKSGIDLDNVLDGKRRVRTPLKNLEKSTPVRASTPTRRRASKSISTASREKHGGEFAETSVFEAESSAAEMETKRRGRFENFVSTTEDEIGDSSKKTRSRRVSKTNKTLVEDDKIFDGLSFILTQSRHVVEDEEMFSAVETETEDDADDASEKSVTSSKPVAMNKRELKKVILKFGGNVLDEFPGPKQKIPDGVLVVSDRYCMTMKYLLAIVHRFQLVNFQWILDCVSLRSKLPLQNYILPGRTL